jgi:hypothetical protein
VDTPIFNLAFWVNKVRPTTETNNATQFKAEQWTIVSDRELWATIMLDGPDKGQPCAFGPKDERGLAPNSASPAKIAPRFAEKCAHEGWGG